MDIFSAILNKLAKFLFRIIWDKLIWRILKAIYRVLYKYLLRHLESAYKWLRKKLSFFIWKTFPSKASDEEVERYYLFIECLGGWRNIKTCSCCSKSWHFKILHACLIDWEKLDGFRVEVLFYEWPYLRIAPSAYSRWIFRRLRKVTNMPEKIYKRYRKSIYFS